MPIIEILLLVETYTDQAGYFKVCKMYASSSRQKAG
jgi:hypothetical protein